MKSLYESIKGIMSEGTATNPNAQGREYSNPRMPGYYKDKTNPAATSKPAVSSAPVNKPASNAADKTSSKPVGSRYGDKDRSLLDMIKGDKDKTSAATAPKPEATPKADTSSDAAKPGTWGNPKTSNPLIAKNREMVAKQQATGVDQAPGRAGRGSYDPAPAKNKIDAAKIEKPTTAKQPFKRPMGGALDGQYKPAADSAPTSNDTPKPTATNASSLAKAQGKETEDKPLASSAPKEADTETSTMSTTHPDMSKAEKKAPTMQKRASILPADTMAKQVASTRDTVNKDFGKDEGDGDGEASKPMAAKVETPKAEAPKAAEKEDGNTKTDADGRTYVRQKGVMGQPDSWNRSYASAGDFMNKIKGKGDVNGKVTAKEAYVNRTFGVSHDLVADIMEVMKKKESSAPRNDKEQDLAAQYGDPKRITHGDILVARGVIKQKKVQEGTMRNGKYVDDAPRPGTNEVPSPDEGYRGAGKPLYTPVDGKKSSKKAQPGGKTNEATDYELDPKLKSPNSDKVKYDPKDPTNTIVSMTAHGNDLKGQQKYKSRTSGGLMNKIKDKLGVDKPDASYGPKEESMDTPGNGYAHQCAIHVKSESFGEGRTITTQHADPDRNGDIAWYDVMFEHGIEKYVPTAELEILVSESHMHSKRKKAVSEGNMYKSEWDRQKAADERTNAQIAKMRERAKQGLGFNVGSTDKPATAADLGDVSDVPNATASQTAKPATPAAAPAPVAKPATPAAAPAATPAPATATAPAPAPAQASAVGAGANKPAAPAPAPAQASAVPPPAGETPEEKARKAAAAKPLPRSKSFSGQGMEGGDF